MDHCQDNDLGLLDAEVDPEGKTRHQRTACIAMYYRIGQRFCADTLKSSERFVQKTRDQALRAAARTMRQSGPDLDPPLP
jgi:hypothetical protein